MKHGPLQRMVVAGLPRMPKALVARFARDYVAGATLDDAIRVVDRLAQCGRLATIDVLGEGHDSVGDARALVEEYLRILDEPPRGPAPSLSLMMTGLGLRIDPSLCWDHLLEVSTRAQECGRLLTVNAEDSTTTDATLDVYRRLRSTGHDHAGIVVQAAMRRALADVQALACLKPRVRLVKGIWVEPYAVAYQDFDAIRRNYALLLETLMDADCYVEIATHDELLVAEALALISRRGLTTEQYEFQMLLGVRPELGELLVRDGHKLRVYVPYGQHWYEYCLRRLKESPDVARHAIAAGVAQTLRPLRKGAAVGA